MEIKNAKYHEMKGMSQTVDPITKKLLDVYKQIICEIDGIVSHVPLDLENRHYVEIMKRVDAGELTIEPADEE